MSRDFHTKLALPKAFCRNLNVEKSANIASGRGSWKVNVGKGSNGMMCFEEGWADFVRQHDLAVGDIVVFEHVGEMDFKAFVFDFTACEKEFDEDLAERNEGSAGVCNNLEAIKTNAGASCQQRDNPYFVITMKHHNSPASKPQYVRIPAEFWKSKGLNQKTSLNLRDPSGKKCFDLTRLPILNAKILSGYATRRMWVKRGLDLFKPGIEQRKEIEDGATETACQPYDGQDRDLTLHLKL
ncbi:B3 domain-containing protein REM10 [Forsythia ovata]|uniref:B3 domain-containing protein REM10 n=1 Tax=Forsythia ovata TaxID=205694 RepID=A0ABD1TMM4_9LAMI